MADHHPFRLLVQRRGDGGQGAAHAGRCCGETLRPRRHQGLILTPGGVQFRVLRPDIGKPLAVPFAHVQFPQRPPHPDLPVRAGQQPGGFPAAAQGAGVHRGGLHPLHPGAGNPGLGLALRGQGAVGAAARADRTRRFRHGMPHQIQTGHPSPLRFTGGCRSISPAACRFAVSVPAACPGKRPEAPGLFR